MSECASITYKEKNKLKVKWEEVIYVSFFIFFLLRTRMLFAVLEHTKKNCFWVATLKIMKRKHTILLKLQASKKNFELKIFYRFVRFLETLKKLRPNRFRNCNIRTRNQIHTCLCFICTCDTVKVQLFTILIKQKEKEKQYPKLAPERLWGNVCLSTNNTWNKRGKEREKIDIVWPLELEYLESMFFVLLFISQAVIICKLLTLEKNLCGPESTIRNSGPKKRKRNNRRCDILNRSDLRLWSCMCLQSIYRLLLQA